ncbi:hypothetical protein ACJX0J_014242, partial [Zea mays]
MIQLIVSPKEKNNLKQILIKNSDRGYIEGYDGTGTWDVQLLNDTDWVKGILPCLTDYLYMLFYTIDYIMKIVLMEENFDTHLLCMQHNKKQNTYQKNNFYSMHVSLVGSRLKGKPRSANKSKEEVGEDFWFFPFPPNHNTIFNFINLVLDIKWHESASCADLFGALHSCVWVVEPPSFIIEALFIRKT